MEIISCPDCTFINEIEIKNTKKICSICERNLIEFSKIEKNYIEAHENYPEFMVPREMIKLGGRINDFYLDFLIDTGCQSSCISYSLAKICGLEHLINTNYSGSVHGVGTKKILGKIMLTEILFDFGFLPVSFLVIEDDEKASPIALLGLDIFFSHGCKIDFKNKCIEFNEQTKINFCSK
jgi:DNA damage-inducible protein 1